MAERACRALKGGKETQKYTFVYMSDIEEGKDIAEAVRVDFLTVPVEFAICTASMLYKTILVVIAQTQMGRCSW